MPKLGRRTSGLSIEIINGWEIITSTREILNHLMVERTLRATSIPETPVFCTQGCNSQGPRSRRPGMSRKSVQVDPGRFEAANRKSLLGTSRTPS